MRGFTTFKFDTKKFPHIQYVGTAQGLVDYLEKEIAEWDFLTYDKRREEAEQAERDYYEKYND